MNRWGDIIVSANNSVAHDGNAVLSLVFAPGHRPDAAALKALAQTSAVPLDFTISHLAPASQGWAELLAMGLTFDCRGMMPAAAAEFPPEGPLLGLDQPPEGEAITLMLGPHLTGGQALIPVVRAIAGVGARLAALPGVRAVCWLPARSWMAPAYFRTVTADWLGGGVFPALGLTTLHREKGGAMTSLGLGWLIGQELRIEAGHGLAPAGVARIAVRLINDLVTAGGLREAVEWPGPAGERLCLTPQHGGIIGVTIHP